MADHRRPAGGAIVETAPAKINLYLHVVGQRTDGYHLLDSLVAFAGVGDRIAIEPGDGNGVTLAVDGPWADRVPTGDENLAVRAAKAFIATFAFQGALRLQLTKRLPVAAGIGGGSADAAAILRGLARLAAVDAGDRRLLALAAGLGADVPVCLRGGMAFIGGIGEAIAPAPALPSGWFALVNPGVPLPTPSVFGARTGPFSKAARFAEAPPDAEGLARLLAARRNDLTAAACRLVPVVGEVLAALDALPGVLLSRMSGSGATCFGLFADAGAAEAAARRLAEDHPRWWVAAAPLLREMPLAP